jgi:hypothetical protein
VVDEPGEVSALGGVDDIVLVDPEEVGRPDALFLVTFLANVGDQWPEMKTKLNRFINNTNVSVVR